MSSVCDGLPVGVNISGPKPVTMATASSHRTSQVLPALKTKTRNSPDSSLRRVDAPVREKNLLAASDISLISLLSENTATTDSPGQLENEKLWSDISRQQICKVVFEWFDLWQPWQQKVLLSGLTDRCSTNQLETLATSLEPIFHRDFVTHLRKKYPTSPFKHSSKKKSLGRSMTPRRASSSSSSVKTSKKSNQNKKSKKNSDKESTNHVLFSIKEKPHREQDVSPKGVSDSFIKSVNSFAEEASKNIIGDALKEFSKPQSVGTPEQCFSPADLALALGNFVTEPDDLNQGGDVMKANQTVISKQTVLTMEDLAEELSGNVMQDAMDVLKERGSWKSTATTPIQCVSPEDFGEALGNFIEIPDDLNQEKTATKSNNPHGNAPDPEQYKRKLSKRSNTLASGSNSRKGNTLPTNQVSSLKDVIENELKKSSLLNARQNVDCLDLHLADRSLERRTAAEHHNSLLNHAHTSESRSAASPQVSSAVDNQRMSTGSISFGLTSHMKREMRTGRVNLPANVRELTFHSQRHLALRPERASTNLVHHSTNTGTSDRFQLQIDKIWQWMLAWKDHEKLSLLSEIVKLCPGDLIKYLTQCLSDRLKERLNMNWLPDRLLLLIFSYLDSDDIETCSKVCRRWRHTVAMDELWMIKCLEYGQYEGIPDIIKRVIDANHKDQSIDWKTAYFELQRIMKDAKSALAKPNPMEQVPAPSVVDEEEVSSPKAEVPLKRGTAAQLARESRRLKGHMTSEDEDDWWSKREARSEGGYPHGRSVTMTPQSTVVSLPRIGQKAKKDGRLSRSLDIISTKSSTSKGSTHTRQDDPKEPLLPALQRQLSPQKAMSEANVASVSSAGHKVTGEQAETKALLQWIKGKKRADDEEGEMALDVRPNLVQATDILGKSESKHLLRWKDNLKINRKYAGQVPSVRRVRKFHGHMDAVLCVAFSARRLISGSMDQSIRVWDVRSGRSIHKMYGHKGAVTCLKFDRNVLYSGSWDMLVMVWDLVTFERIRVLPGHRGTVSSLAINDQYLVSGSHDATVRVYRRRILHCEKTLHIHESHIVDLQLNGTDLISASSDKTVRLTNIENGASRKVILRHPEPIHKMLLEGSLLITATQTGRVFFWNYSSGESEAGIQAHDTKHPINALVFHRGRFFTASGDHTVKEWDLLTMTCVRSLQGHKAAIQDFKVSDKRMVSCSTDGQIRVWDFEIPPEKLAEVADDTIPYEVVHQQNV